MHLGAAEPKGSCRVPKEPLGSLRALRRQLNASGAAASLAKRLDRKLQEPLEVPKKCVVRQTTGGAGGLRVRQNAGALGRP